MIKMELIDVPGMPPLNATYSQAVRVGSLVFVSGQVGCDPITGKLVSEGIGEQTEQLFRNTRCILESSGSSLDRIVRVSIYITDASDLDEMNRVFAEYIKNPPAKVLGIVAGLFGGAKVEMEFIALAK